MNFHFAVAYLVDFIIKKAVFHDVPILIILLLNLTIFCAKNEELQHRKG